MALPLVGRQATGKRSAELIEFMEDICLVIFRVCRVRLATNYVVRVSAVC